MNEPRRRLTVHQQAAALGARWPQFHVSVLKGQLVARGRVRGSAITDEYSVRIQFRPGKSPRIDIENPALQRRQERPDEPIPHTYGSSTPGCERPCVYYPRSDWNEGKLIAETVLPWLQCWLVDYEVWRATGVWHGGGKHSSAKQEPGAA